jgi:DNA-binding XRE family transcriptional regulator
VDKVYSAMPSIKPTREDVDRVSRRLLKTVGEPETEKGAASREDRLRVAASRLRQARKLKGLTQQRLARALGISEGHLQAIETGRRRPSLEVQAKVYAWLLKHGLEHFFYYCLILALMR